MEISITKDELNKIAKDILVKASKTTGTTATVIGLKGELGSGKTTLTQEIGKELGVKESLTSPTFVIMKIYSLKNKKFKQLIHIDAYRLNKDSELLHLGWQELLKDKNNLIIIEWPERVEGCMPKKTIYVELAHEKENTRSIKF